MFKRSPIIVGTAAFSVVIALSGATLAADLPVRTAPAPAPTVSVFSWTGFYAGVQGGWLFGENETTLLDAGVTPIPLRPLGIDPESDLDGFVGGAHVGYLQQLGGFVLGAEADIEYSGAESDLLITDPTAPGFSLGVATDVTWQGSLRARLGAAFDRTLVYATGGLAFAQFEDTFSASVPVAVVTGGGLVLAAGTYRESFDQTQWGWTVGAGVQHAFTDRLSGRIEYRYTDFGSYTNMLRTISPGDGYRNDAYFHAVRAGVSYTF
ncbi:outer membrane protein [Salinarimonas sp. NSM]|uniref:outer membrane protein n=1 Tax=Salinarimonas sp. NSM TaxID=3458003 RepID=UPI0040352C14